MLFDGIVEQLLKNIECRIDDDLVISQVETAGA
jgi:hypothetical protein